MVRRHLVETLGRFPLYVGIGDDWPDLIRRLGIDDDDDPRDKIDARTYYQPDGRRRGIGVWLAAAAPHSALPDLVSVVAHEAVHVVDFLFEAVGEDGSPSELPAYLVGWVAETLIRDVEKQRMAEEA